eukprot:9498669-Pyramimonas_sp.AAC.1
MMMMMMMRRARCSWRKRRGLCRLTVATTGSKPVKDVWQQVLPPSLHFSAFRSLGQGSVQPNRHRHRLGLGPGDTWWVLALLRGG